MPVNSVHPTYGKYIREWEKCRDVVEGTKAVKRGDDKYLPKLGEQTEDEYAAYKERALFYGVAKRTVQGLGGAITRRPSAVTWPKAKEDMLKDLGCEGESLDTLAKDVIEEVLTTARVGLLVDADETGEGLPYVTMYIAENVINWRAEKVRGKKVLTLVVLREEVEAPGGDEYEVKCEYQYRVCKLVDGYYVQEVWRENPAKKGAEGGDGWELVTPAVYPARKGGKKYTYIPFCFVTPSGVTAEVEPSPIIDLADANLSHYRSSADLEHGRHFTGLPTAWVAGFDKATKLRIGSSVAWVSDDPNARAGFLEFTGQGLQSLENALKEKETYMSILGSRLLEPQKKQTEATDTVLVRQNGEQSMLANISQAVSDGLTLVLGWVADWSRVAEAKAVGIVLNKNFNVVGLDFNMVAQLMLGCQQGTLSWDTFFWNLQRGELVPDDRTPETERKLISAGIPMPELNPSDPANQPQAGAGATSVSPARRSGKANKKTPKKDNSRAVRKKTKQNRGA